MKDVPLDVLHDDHRGLGAVDLQILRHNRRIPVEHMEVQDWIWHGGQKYLSYGDIFVQV